MIVFGRFRKSRHSNPNGECVEVANWRKASHSLSNGNCVEVGTSRTSSHGVAIRDTQDRDGAVLVVSPQAWAQFTAQYR